VPYRWDGDDPANVVTGDLWPRLVADLEQGAQPEETERMREYCQSKNALSIRRRYLRLHVQILYTQHHNGVVRHKNSFQSYGASSDIWDHLTSDTGKRAPPKPQPDRPVFVLSSPEGWKAELVMVLDI